MKIMGPPLDDALMALDEAAASTLNRRGRRPSSVSLIINITPSVTLFLNINPLHTAYDIR